MSEALSRVLDLRARHEYAEARELARTAAEDDAEPALSAPDRASSSNAFTRSVFERFRAALGHALGAIRPA